MSFVLRLIVRIIFKKIRRITITESPQNAFQKKFCPKKVPVILTK
jgi:hypothetical protein